ncbi:MAG TPA: hypothetical protein VNL73_02265 [Verrucomicrobiae bacterium]|nr:hypothetical protein [Verrucomicrobiae bacterium]
MNSLNQSQLAFYLTGQKEGTEELGLCPALLASYRDLTRLRYDFPLVLTAGNAAGPGVRGLSELMDDLRREVATGEDSLRVNRHMLRLEEEIRKMAVAGVSGPLTTLWNRAAERLGVRESPLLRDSLDRARAALRVEGDVIDCNAGLPGRLLLHFWQEKQKEKAVQFKKEIARLSHQLFEILRADFVHSAAGTSVQNLQDSFGPLHSADFDFAEMSRLLTGCRPAQGLTEGRQRRIHRLLSIFKLQHFYPSAESNRDNSDYSFVFDSACGALRSYRERLPALAELVGAVLAAKLEISGEYNETLHDSYFKTFSAEQLDPQDLAGFPDYFVHIDVDRLDAEETAALTEILSAGLPMKMLLQTDDILDGPALGGRQLGLARRSRPLVQLALGLNEVYVLQSASSHLYQMRDELLRGFTCSGPALFHIFSGAAKTAGRLPAYLVAAAAMESRAFPAFVYDPTADAGQAGRFRLETNPQTERDWPVQKLSYEDDKYQNVTEELPFTLADFMAMDARFAGHFTNIPKEEWNETLVFIDDCLNSSGTGMPEKLPILLMVDANNRLQRVLVDEKMLREARRCLEAWKHLRDLAQPQTTIIRAPSETVKEVPSIPAPSVTPVQPLTVTPTAAPSEAKAEISSDDPYIETPRCTTCNECTNINSKMFAYNENKQAYIANPDAGTFAQLVEAAESCQVAIIHPGKPRNPNEPNLEELLARAEPFR